MVSHVTTVAFQGIEAVPVDVQVQIAPGGPVLAIVGLPDKTVAESRERIRCALEVSMIASIAGEPSNGRLTSRRPFRTPHHSASMAAMVGGGMRAKPGRGGACP